MANPVATPRSKYWFNNDGLMIWYGTSEATVGTGGEYGIVGNRHYLEVTIDLTTLPAYNATADGDVQVLEDTITIPNGAFLEQVDVLVTKETTGTNANLDIGLVDQNRVTEIDFDGILAAADAFNGTTDLGTITSYFVGTTEAGALIGTKITNTGYLTARADTADFTAGIIKVRVWWTVPLSTDTA